MTQSQLESVGVVYNKWLNSEELFSQILFSNDGSLWTSENLKLYFSTNGILYVRHLKNGNTVLPASLSNNKVGKYHDVYSISNISLVNLSRNNLILKDE